MSRMRKAKKIWKAEGGVNLTSVFLQMEIWKYLNLRRKIKSLFLNVKTDLNEGRLFLLDAKTTCC